jgi:hypothetical protein
MSAYFSGLVVGGGSGSGSGQPTHPGSVVPVVSRQTPAPNRSRVGGKSPDLKKNECIFQQQK